MGRILIKGSSNGIFAPIISNIRRPDTETYVCVSVCVSVEGAEKNIDQLKLELLYRGK